MNGDEPRNYRLYGVLLTGLLVVIGAIYWFVCWQPPTTVLLVRHADRQGSTDALSPAGALRAQALAHAMEKSGITALYQSEFVRTQQTAGPTATLLGLTPIVITSADVTSLVNDIRANRAGETVLVVGHSNTVPQIIAGLAGPAVTIPDNEFDNLYALTICRCYRSVGMDLTNMQYGVPSP